jgi:hypothetical protein
MQSITIISLLITDIMNLRLDLGGTIGEFILKIKFLIIQINKS